jgi:hypothetical protein
LVKQSSKKVILKTEQTTKETVENTQKPGD